MSFGDIRVSARAEWLVDQIAARGTLVARRLGATRAGEMAVHGFLSSPYVSVAGIVDMAASLTAEQCAGRHVLAVQDTTEINFSGRDKKRRGFGPGGDGKAPGFFIHPVIAVDVESEAVLGLVDAAIWTRRDSAGKATRRARSFEQKESARWLSGCQAAAQRLGQARRVTMVADRESDIYSLFARRPEGLDVILRAAHDRALAEGGYVFQALAEEKPLGTSQVRVPPRGPGQKERIATVALRAGNVRLARPRNNRLDELPETVALCFVEAREVDGPETGALLWRLYTTHSVTCFEQANTVVQLYRLRWRIEQTFRALKSDGLALEDSQLTEPERLFNLAALGLIAALRTIQLVDARDGSPRPASDVIDQTHAPALEHISKTLEGKTERQKNPHAPGSLAFVAWIAARLGGWNCYYKPPGPKTMRTGWDRLAPMLEGYAIANQGKNP